LVVGRVEDQIYIYIYAYVPEMCSLFSFVRYGMQKASIRDIVLFLHLPSKS